MVGNQYDFVDQFMGCHDREIMHEGHPLFCPPNRLSTLFYAPESSSWWVVSKHSLPFWQPVGFSDRSFPVDSYNAGVLKRTWDPGMQVLELLAFGYCWIPWNLWNHLLKTQECREKSHNVLPILLCWFLSWRIDYYFTHCPQPAIFSYFTSSASLTFMFFSISIFITFA